MWCEREILPSDGDYLAECFRQGVLNNMEDLEHVLQQYLDYHIETKTELALLKDQVGIPLVLSMAVLAYNNYYHMHI